MNNLRTYGDKQNSGVIQSKLGRFNESFDMLCFCLNANNMLVMLLDGLLSKALTTTILRNTSHEMSTNLVYLLHK